MLDLPPDTPFCDDRVTSMVRRPIPPQNCELIVFSTVPVLKPEKGSSSTLHDVAPLLAMNSTFAIGDRLTRLRHFPPFVKFTGAVYRARAEHLVRRCVAARPAAASETLGWARCHRHRWLRRQQESASPPREFTVGELTGNSVPDDSGGPAVDTGVGLSSNQKRGSTATRLRISANSLFSLAL